MLQSENIFQSICHQLQHTLERRETEAIARLLCEDTLGLNFSQALCKNITDLNTKDTELLKNIISRLQKGEPVQYILGQADFCGHSFKVNSSVLIPRPETEDLVNFVIGQYKNVSGHTPLTICDAGTGSGCIAISLKLAIPKATVYALDISTKALETAKKNADQLNAEIFFLQADILQETTLPDGPWDIIVSNPPYVRYSEKKEIETRVKDFEPSIALFVSDNNALLFYRALAQWAIKSLKTGGLLFCEINTALAQETNKLMKDEGFRKTILLQDRYKKRRFLQCKK